MTRLFKEEPLSERRNYAIEIAGETRFAEDELQLRHRRKGLPDRIAVRAEPRRHLDKNAMDLAHLLFGEANEFVVEIDGFERLDEQRMPAGARAVDHAVELAPLSCDDGHDEALIADRDELFLQHAF